MSNAWESIKDRLIRLEVAMAWGAKARQEFYGLLAEFVSDGVPVYEAVQEIHQRYVQIRDPRRHVTQRILDDSRGLGGPVKGLGESLDHSVPSLESMAIDAGESSSSVAQGLRMAANLAEVSSRIKTTITGQLSYPLALIIMLCLFLIGISAVLLPVFEGLLPREQWPTAAAWLGLVADNAVLIAGGIASSITGVFLAFFLSAGLWVGNVRDFFDRRVAPWSIYRRITGAIFMACIAALTNSGVPFSQVIHKLGTISTPWARDHLDRMRSRLRKGSYMGEAMSGELFDADIRWKIEVYGRRTNFASALESLSLQVQELTLARIKRASSIVRFVVYTLMTVMFGWVYSSFLSLSFAARGASSML